MKKPKKTKAAPAKKAVAAKMENYCSKSEKIFALLHELEKEGIKFGQIKDDSMTVKEIPKRTKITAKTIAQIDKDDAKMIQGWIKWTKSINKPKPPKPGPLW